MGKPFPCDQQTPQAVHEQKLLEEYDLSNALRAYGETQDCNLKSGRSGSVCAPANGNRRTPLKNPRRQSSSKKDRWKEALQSHSPSVRFMLSMLPRTVETVIMKIHITSFWVPNPGGLTLKCQVFLCVSFKYFVYFSMLGLRLCSYLILFIFACIYFKKKKSARFLYSSVVYVIAGRTENLPWRLHYCCICVSRMSADILPTCFVGVVSWFENSVRKQFV